MDRDIAPHSTLRWEAATLRPTTHSAAPGRVARVGANDTTELVAEQILSKNFSRDKDLDKKIYAFGSKTKGPNMFVDMCKGVRYLSEIRDSVVVSFQCRGRATFTEGIPRSIRN